MDLKSFLSALWLRNANLVIAVLSLGFVSVSSFNLFYLRRPPQIELDMQILTPVIRRGEPLIVESTGTRNELCIVTMSRWIKNVETGVTTHKANVPGGFYDLGPWREKVRVDLPKYIDEGIYALRLLQHNDCGDRVFPLAFPERTFRVVNQD